MIKHVKTHSAIAAPNKVSTHDYAEEGKSISAAMKKLGYKVTPGDVEEWFEGTDDDNGDAERMDAAAKKLLGIKTYQYYDSVARLATAVMAKLGLYKDEATIKKMGGGIDLLQNFDKPKVTSASTAPGFAAQLKKGVRVVANFGSANVPEYYLATVTKNNAAQGTVNVLFDDGHPDVYRAIQSKAGIVGLAIAKKSKAVIPVADLAKWLLPTPAGAKAKPAAKPSRS